MPEIGPHPAECFQGPLGAGQGLKAAKVELPQLGMWSRDTRPTRGIQAREQFARLTRGIVRT
jgi:hypothetical protein